MESEIFVFGWKSNSNNMANELKNILSNQPAQINANLLKAYAANTLSQEERHAVEMALSNSDEMEEDALDGLLESPQPSQLPAISNEINQWLHQQLRVKTTPPRPKIPFWPIIWIFCGVLLIFVLIGWWVIYTFLK